MCHHRVQRFAQNLQTLCRSALVLGRQQLQPVKPTHRTLHRSAEHATNHDWSRNKKHPPKLRTSIVLDAHPVGMAQDQRRGGPVGGNGVLCCFGWGLSSSNSNQLRRFVPIQEVRPGRSMWNLKTTGLWRKLVFQGVFSGSM